MRFCLAVPTYWTFAGGQGPSEVFFDHPTPVDTQGTLRRLLDSLVPLVQSPDTIVVVAAATSASLAAQVEARLQEIVAAVRSDLPLRFFSCAHLASLQDFCQRRGRPEFCPLLALQGYGAIRNLTLVLANLLGADVLVSLDDDEIITDPLFLKKIGADIALLGRDQPRFGLAGLYESPEGSILAAEPRGDWVKFWPKMRWLNEACAALAGATAPLQPTPLALGGNMAIPASLYGFLPFDPALPRGEDTDYVLNARLFGVPFYLDAQLRVVHAPPAKPHPVWLRLRQDLQRFSYTRQKLLAQEQAGIAAPVRPADFFPYPGRFLTADLEIMAYRAHVALAREYLADGEVAAAQETLKNLLILERPPSATQVLSAYLEVVSRWQRLQGWFAQPAIRQAALEAIWG
mgnify:CR=1 FL=1